MKTESYESYETIVLNTNGKLYIVDPFLQDLKDTLFYRLFVYPRSVTSCEMAGITVAVAVILEGGVICVAFVLF